MSRWAWLILALAATNASGRLTTFAWDNDSSWPAGTTVELCSNGVCASGITGTQHTLDVPIVPGGRFDARARAVTTDGQVSDWSTLTQTWAADPVGAWSHFETDAPLMAIAYTHLDGGTTNTSNPTTTASITPTANAQVIVAIGIGLTTTFGSSDFGSISVSGCNLTWQQVSVNTNSASRRGLWLWRGVGSSPTTGSLTITYTPPGSLVWASTKYSVDEFTGLDSTTPLGTAVSTIAVGVTSSSVSLSAPSTGDWAYSAVSSGGNQDSTINGELDTDLYEIRNSDALALLHAAADTAPDSTPAPGFSYAGSITAYQTGFLLKAAAVSAATALPRRALDGPLFGALRGSVR